MRLKAIYLILTAVAVLDAATESAAQKYPERRIARGANSAYQKGDFEKAEVEYRRSLEMNPELKEAENNLGNALFKQGKMEEAAKIYERFATDSLSTPTVAADNTYNLGNVALAANEWDSAIEMYKQALRINPSDMEAKWNLAYARKMKDESEDDNQQDDQDNEGDGGGGGGQDQNDDQSDNQNDGDQDQDNGDQDQNNGGQDQNQDNQQNESQNGESEARLSQQEAEELLDVIQGEEDKTREKMDGKKVKAVGRSGKNW